MLKCVYLSPTYDEITDNPPLYLCRESILHQYKPYMIAKMTVGRTKMLRVCIELYILDITAK